MYDWRSERREDLDPVVNAWDDGDSSEDEGSVSGGGVGARRVEKSSSLTIKSSRDWMVESPRWRVGSSSDSEFEEVLLGCFSCFGVRASLRIPCSADLGKRGPEYLRGAWFCNFGRSVMALGLSLCINSAAPRLPLPNCFWSCASDGVGIGGPRPPVGRGVSIQAPVTRGVLRMALTSALETCGASSIVWSTHAPVMTGVLRSLIGLEFCGVCWT